MNNSDLSMNPGGGDAVWRSDREPALDNLMARILERDNVWKAWQRVKSNKGAPGIDGMSLGRICKLKKDSGGYLQTPLTALRTVEIS